MTSGPGTFIDRPVHGPAEADTEQKTLRALKESEDRFRNLANNLNVGIYRNTPGPEGRFIEANDAIVTMFGFDSKADFLASRVVDLYQNPDDRIAFNEKMKTYGGVTNEEIHLKRADGSPFIGSVSTVAVRDDNEAILYYDGIIVDVTERRMGRTALIESESKFRTLFDLSPQAVALVHFDTAAITDVNTKYCELFKAQRETVIGKTPVALGVYPQKDRERFLSMLRANGEVRGLDMDLRAGDGSIVNTHMFSRVITIGGDRYILTIFHDFSEKKQLETQLRHAQKMESIGTLAGGIAHDFNNILSAIIGYSEIIKIGADEDPGIKNKVSHILAASDRARELVRQILAFSRQHEQEIKLMAVAPVIKEAVQLLRASLPSTIEIRTDLPARRGLVSADPTQIHQVIMNLCTNAAHAMESSGGRLDIALKRYEFADGDPRCPLSLKPGRYLRLSIRDTGHGMPPEIVERIFDPYFTTKEKGVGTGLGLAVVHGIVAASGGAVTVRSKPGRGSVFHVYLPLVEAEASEKETRSDDLPGGSESILVVDDEVVLLAIAEELLEWLGYRVHCASCGTDALDLLKKDPRRFDLVITDLTMPKMTGKELVREILNIRPDMPVILCTGHAAALSGEQMRELGIRAFAVKPIAVENLARLVRQTLDADPHDLRGG